MLTVTDKCISVTLNSSYICDFKLKSSIDIPSVCIIIAIILLGYYGQQYMNIVTTSITSIFMKKYCFGIKFKFQFHFTEKFI